MNPESDTNTAASILVVDDTPMNLQLLVGMLKEYGYTVRPAPSGELALQAAFDEAPDLILLDINMPLMNGYEVCERLKADENLKSVPVIFISALDDMFDKVKAFRVGAVDYVTKPFQFEEVEARVRAHLALRRKECLLQKSLAQQKELERLRDSLVHMIVHDMRSPLTVISTCLNMLQEGLAADRRAADELLQEADSAASALNKMTTQLLDISRLEAGQMPLKKERHDLAQTMQVTSESLAALARGRRISLKVPPSSMAYYDADIVGRVVANILANAFKFTPPDGQITLTVARQTEFFRVVVIDNGRGIPPEHQQKIFDKFAQVELRNKYVGTGLGLAFCKLAVEAHGGQIGVESELGHGSAFWFTLPTGPVG
jgi:two-component system, sensor histidine kinase and response regulator